MQYEGKYIVSYLLGGFDAESAWEAFDTLEEAKSCYNDLLEDETLVTANISKTIEITLEDMKRGMTLDLAKAEQFLEDDDSIDLCEMTSITDEAAESLSKHEGTLELDGLTDLSDAAVESLSRHKGDLGFSGLTSITDAAAESLSKHEGELFLNGLTALTDAVAESLSKSEGGLLLFRPELSAQAAKYLLEGVVVVDTELDLEDIAKG
jgi:hypothetical protein